MRTKLLILASLLSALTGCSQGDDETAQGYLIGAIVVIVVVGVVLAIYRFLRKR